MPVHHILFQFHNGSIKSGHFKIQYATRYYGFNSTMVRLKVNIV